MSPSQMKRSVSATACLQRPLSAGTLDPSLLLQAMGQTFTSLSPSHRGTPQKPLSFSMPVLTQMSLQLVSLITSRVIFLLKSHRLNICTKILYSLNFNNFYPRPVLITFSSLISRGNLCVLLLNETEKLL